MLSTEYKKINERIREEKMSPSSQQVHGDFTFTNKKFQF
jgi:hypothetical protein